MSHTPGPWHAPGLGEIHDEQHRVIADCWAEEFSSKEPEANARLIAAAPDLLAALEMFVGKYGRVSPNGSGGMYDLVLQARAAIAKARGA